MKNLKGCLKFSSKKRAHKRVDLYDLIAQLNMHIKSDLVIIDGTYAMERGPTMGTAHRMNLIIVGTDILETDMVGAAVLGKDPKKINHIQNYCQLSGRSIDLNSIEIKGETIESVAKDLSWEGDFNKCFKNFGLTGIQVSSQTADTSICSGCYGNMEFANYMFSKDNSGINVDGFEICIGKDSKPTPDARKVILFGDCAIKKNQSDNRAIQVPGCPPDFGQYYPLLVKKALPKGRSISLLLTRMAKNYAFKMGLYRENFGLWDDYKSSAFDQNHF